MDKARLTTQKGNMEEIFKVKMKFRILMLKIIVAEFLFYQVAHVNIFATTSSEVTLRAIIDKVSSASGSKSHVK